MFQRISRLIQAFFNQFITAAENPVIILENNIRELQTSIPKLNEAVAKSYGAVIMLQKQLSKYIDEASTLDKQIKAAIKLGQEDAAKELILQLQSVKEKEDKLSEDLKLAQQKLEQTTELRDFKVAEIKTKINEIKGAIEEHKFSEMQKSIVDATDPANSFDVNGLAISTDEMLGKLNQQTAQNQGTFAASLSSSAPDLKNAQIQREAKLMEADDILLEYKKDMGLETDKVTVDAE